MKKDIFDELKEISENKIAKIAKLQKISDENDFNAFMNRYKNDPVGFIENVASFFDSAKGSITKPVLYPHQKELLRAYMDDRFNIVHAARQIGISRTMEIIALHHAYFNDNQYICIIEHNESSRRAKLQGIHDLYELLPEIYHQKNPLVKSTRTTLEFANGTCISTRPFTGDVLRGSNVDLLLIDNFAMADNYSQDSMLQALIPLIRRSNTLKIFIGMTGMGIRSVGAFVENGFFSIWKGAYNDCNMFTPYSYSWDTVPGRGQGFKYQMRKNIGEKAWKAEFEVIPVATKDGFGKWQEQKMRD